VGTVLSPADESEGLVPHASTGSVDKDQFPHLGGGVLEAGQDTQLLRDLVGSTADIHGIAARSDALVAFHDSYPVAGPTELRRQRRPPIPAPEISTVRPSRFIS
jgi:hypothetical protein